MRLRLGSGESMGGNGWWRRVLLFWYGEGVSVFVSVYVLSGSRAFFVAAVGVGWGG